MEGWAETGYTELHHGGRVQWRIHYEGRDCPDCNRSMMAEPGKGGRVYYHCPHCHRAIRAAKSSYRLEMPAT